MDGLLGPARRVIPTTLVRLASTLWLPVIAVTVQAVFPSTTLAQGGSLTETKLLASDGAVGDQLGFSVAAAGNTIVVGAFADDDRGPDSGSVYVFERRGGAWVETAKLTASDGAADDHFGVSVAIDGDTIAVGAPLDDDKGPDSGSVYVFERRGGAWVETAKLTASDGAPGDIFSGVAVAGNTIVVGARAHDDNGPDSGAAYVFERRGGTWIETAKLIAPDGAAGDRFGSRVATAGNTIVVGALLHDDNGPDSGSAYVFERKGGAWAETAELTASDGAAGDQFGSSVVAAGDTIVVGAFLHDDNGPNSGSAYVFERKGGAWAETARLAASDGAAGDQFGASVSAAGNTIVVGAVFGDGNVADSGSAYVFERRGGAWIESAKLTASDGGPLDSFGRSVAVAGKKIVVGAPSDDDNGFASGSAYVFD